MATRTWSGVIAHIGIPTSDGRELGPPDDRMVQEHVPVIGPRDGRWSERPRDEDLRGEVDRVWLDAGDVRASGSIRISGNSDWAEQLLRGETMAVGAAVITDHVEPGQPLIGWRLRHLLLHSDPTHAVWPDVGITLDPA